jgi:hypothetical protein
MWGPATLTGALDVHEVRVGRLHEALELVLPLLELSGGVEEVDGESLRGVSGGRAVLDDEDAPFCCELDVEAVCVAAAGTREGHSSSVDTAHKVRAATEAHDGRAAEERGQSSDSFFAGYGRASSRTSAFVGASCQSSIVFGIQ